jgi:tetratricopeptide (TPR) repeat protein
MDITRRLRAAESTPPTRVGWRGSRRAHYRAATTTLRLAAALAPAHSVVRARALSALGVTCKDRGQYPHAEAAYLAAAAQLEALAQRDLLLLAALEHNLAGLAHARGHHVEGLPHARAAIALRSQAAPDDHVALAADQAVLASLLAGVGQTDEARATFTRVLATIERAYGPDHYETAVVLHNLAALDPDPDHAVAIQQRVLAIKERVLGAHHPEVAAARANLGVLHQRAGQDEEALASYQRALPVLERRLCLTHPATIACATNLESLRQRHRHGTRELVGAGDDPSRP